ncbi:MAG: hypothetical protein JHC12_05510 [Thermogladius sp.]|nr:hypothetical protein [Thermogladius sp.]
MIEFDLLKLEPREKIATAEDVRLDLELDKIIGVAASNDKLIAETWLEVLLSKECPKDVTEYRQEAVRDALKNRGSVLRMYQIAREGYEKAYREVFLYRLDDPKFVVNEASSGVSILVDYLEKLLEVVSNTSFTSIAFRSLADSLISNVDKNFIDKAREINSILGFGSSVDFSVEIGVLNSLVNPVLLLPRNEGSIVSRLLSGEKKYTYRLDPRDEAGARILEDLRNWVLAGVATTVLNAFDKLLGFFRELARQLSFYVGAINLSDFLEKAGIPKTYPEINPRKLYFENLYPLSLAISSGRKPVPNSLDLDVDGSFAVIVTGVNKGGKTTFLKSLGQALLLARAGLFVPAERFVIPSTGAVYTHFLREEERTFSYGKFEEEVKRFRTMVEAIKRGDYVLMDESFVSTNHVEASVVAENVVSALLDSGVNVIYITFLQDFLHRFIPKYSGKAVLLVPERLSDGTRTYKLVKGSIQPGYALEVWRKIAGENMNGETA